MRSTESQNAVRPRSTVEASEGVRRPRATSVTKLTAAGTRPPPHAMASIERPFDVTMLVTIAMLMGFGVVMVYSASVGVADMTYGDPLRFLKSHLLHLMVGVVAFAVGMGLNYQFYRRLVYPLLMLGMGLLVLTWAFGEVRGNARRWIELGPLDFQAAELVKVAFVIYLAYSLEKKIEEMVSWTTSYLPHLVVGGAFMTLLVIQPDLGSALLLGAVLVAMQVVAGTRWTNVVATIFLAVPLGLGYITASRATRWEAWVGNPWDVRDGAGYQPVQALMSIGSGGWHGLGLGAGRQKMGFLTQSHTDFIYATVGEELGFIGCGLVIGLFCLLCWRGYRAAWKAPDRFGRYLAFGFTTLFGVQAFVNMAVATTLLPTKGLNLPFVSGGGTSMLFSCFAAGVLLNISRYAEAPSTWRPMSVPDSNKPRATADFVNVKRPEKKPVKFKGQVGPGVVAFDRNTGRGR